jgi:hypothetical protein
MSSELSTTGDAKPCWVSETKNLAGLKHSNKDRKYQKKACNNSLNINITGDWLSREGQFPLIHKYHSSSHFNLGILILRAPRKHENFTLSRHCARWMDNIDGGIHCHIHLKASYQNWSEQNTKWMYLWDCERKLHNKMLMVTRQERKRKQTTQIKTKICQSLDHLQITDVISKTWSQKGIMRNIVVLVSNGFSKHELITCTLLYQKTWL